MNLLEHSNDSETYMLKEFVVSFPPLYIILSTSPKVENSVKQ